MRTYLSLVSPKALLASVALLLFPLVSQAQNDVLIILSADSKIYSQFEHSIKNELGDLSSIDITYANDATEELLNNYNLIITAGAKSAQIISGLKLKTPIIYSLIPKDFYRSSIHGKACPGISCYSIHIEQPITRYLQLISLLFDKNRTVAVPVLIDHHHISYKHFSSEADRKDIKYKIINIRPDDNIPRTLSRHLKKNDVLLALPDPDIYNRDTARSIILTTYHNNVPIIGYSQAFAKAGALASLYSSIDDIADQTANVTRQVLNNKEPRKKVFYPHNFSIEINSAVAHSLNITIPSQEYLMGEIK